MKILLASSNTHKKTEIARYAQAARGVAALRPGITFSCDEDGEDFIENAMLKANALHAARAEGVVIMADDRGCVSTRWAAAPASIRARYGM
jgi:inosine/xanthosine triphosphate pyrophosphatase family protein